MLESPGKVLHLLPAARIVEQVKHSLVVCECETRELIYFYKFQ